MSSNVIQLIPNVEQAFLTFPGYIQFSSYIYIYVLFSNIAFLRFLQQLSQTQPSPSPDISSDLEHPQGFRDIPLLGAAVEDGVVHDFIRGKMPIPFHLLWDQIRDDQIAESRKSRIGIDGRYIYIHLGKMGWW